MATRVKIIIAFLVVAVLGGIAYLMFFNTNNVNSAVSTSGSTQPASAAEVTFLNLASQINPISFDTSIIADPRFAALVDIHTAVLPEPLGRKDPFLPL
jgi:hypothetical protein